MRTNHSDSSFTRIARSVLLAGGVLLTSVVAFAPAAEARDHDDRGRKQHHAYRYTDVPRHMHRLRRDEFRHAYAGRAYYRPHHHNHAIYRYPVVVGGIVTYRPYHYCNDELWVTGYAPLPRVVVGVNVRPGIRIHIDAH